MLWPLEKFLGDPIANALFAAIARGDRVQMAMPSVGTLHYNEGLSSPWHDCGKMKRPRMFERRFAMYLEEKQGTKRRKIFVQGGLARECLSETCVADAKGGPSHTEVILHDEFAAMTKEFGMTGAKAKADEKKHRQSNLNELTDKTRLTLEKLQAHLGQPSW